MKRVFFIMVIILFWKTGFTQSIKESQILSSFEEGNYEVVECKYIPTYLKDSSIQTKFIWVKFHRGIFREATITSAPFRKKGEMYFVSIVLILDSTWAKESLGIAEPVSIKRTKDDLLSEYCRDAVFRFNELLVVTLPKKHCY